MNMDDFCDGANTMRGAIWHTLAPALGRMGYTNSTIAMLFRDIGLMDEITPDNINELRETASREFYLRQLETESDSK